MIIDTTVKLEHWHEIMVYLEQKFRRKKPRPRVWHEWLVEVSLYIIFLATLFYFDFELDWNSVLIATMFFIFVFVGWLLHEVRMKAQVRPKDDGVILGEKRYELLESGIYVRTKYHEARISWDVITELLELKTVFVLLVEDLEGVVIPKEALDDLDEFKRLVGTHLNDRGLSA